MNSLALQSNDQCKGAGGSWVDMNVLYIARDEWL